MKRIATFWTNGKMLIGGEAKKAWAAQTARCNCGSEGDESHAIDGTCEGRSAKWLGCDNCSGQALGRPLVYRSQSQVAERQ